MLSPDGRSVLYLKDGQIYRARVSQAPATSRADKGEVPFIRAWGQNSGPRWSPDGSKVAFVSNRTTHSFIAVYDVKTHSVNFMAAGVDRDTSPTWSPDSKTIAFLRRPGSPFGLQPTPGRGSGMPDATAGRQGGGGVAGRQGGAPAAGAGTGHDTGSRHNTAHCDRHRARPLSRHRRPAGRADVAAAAAARRRFPLTRRSPSSLACTAACCPAATRSP